MVAYIVFSESKYNFFTKEPRTLKPNFVHFHLSILEVSKVQKADLSSRAV